MTVLILGLIIFLGVHSLSIVAEPWRNRMAERLGEGPFKGLYSLVALVGLVLLIWGYGQARLEPVVIYTPPMWMRHLAMVLLIPVFVLLFATYLPGRIQRAVKHPMLVAVKLWALAHLLANGMLADVLLFGGFLAWAVADRISLKRRAPRAKPELPHNPMNDIIAIAGGLVVYALFVVWLHRVLIGVAPVAM
ncbi:NnrU family protein [Marinobacter fonticola]|uniref:NnrU family protein n=1 Tax=Marinobacter fonticola TaxID=2603215 RepID=UPI0011E88957|nr:NnrU family protein [Marinobacter fonticola]